MSTLEERVNEILEGMADFEGRLALIENLHTYSDATKRDPFGYLTVENAQNKEDILYSAEETVEIYRILIDQVGSLRESLSKHINLHSKKKDKDYY